MSNPRECPQSLVVERVFPHPPEKLWRALTESPLLAQWMMNNDFEPVVGRKFQFRAEAGNLFNHPSAGNPNSEIEQGFDPTNPVATSNFGSVTTTSTFYTPRSIQLAGKIVF